jgi:hypothetical protein
MKIIYLTLVLVVFSCQTKTQKSVPEKLKTENPILKKVVIESNKFSIGDINNDKIEDTAYVNIKRNIETGEIECGNKNCYVNIEFNQNVPKISFDQSLGVYIKKTEDLNNDNSNEILIFSRSHEGWWNYISIFSFNGKKWVEIAKTKGFCAEDKDFENRILNDNGNYYLIGENQWEEDEKGNFKRVKVKI